MLVNMKKMLNEYITVKNFCKINNISYKSFRTSKNYNFQNKIGVEVFLKILLKDNLINLEDFNACVLLYKASK